jgi:hypothetical protein
VRTRGTGYFLVFILIILVPLLIAAAARLLFKPAPPRVVSLDPAAFSGSSLPAELVRRVCALKESLAEVDAIPAAKTIALLEKEKDPAREVAIQETIAKTYREEAAARGITDLSEKRMVYRILVNASLRNDEDFIISAVPGSEHLEYLSELLGKYRKNTGTCKKGTGY